MNLLKVFSLGGLVLLAAQVACAVETRPMPPGPTSLEEPGTLASADVVHPAGTRGHDYGDPPKGVLHVDRAGHYAMFIFNPGRSTFAANDKSKGTSEEYRGAIMRT